MEGSNAFVYDRLAPIGMDFALGDADEIVEAPAVRSEDGNPGASAAPGSVIEISDGEAEIDYISLAVDGLVKAVEQEEDPDEALVNLAASDELDLEVDNYNDKKIWPWMEARETTFRSPVLQLHQEILDFCTFISPTVEEEAERAAAINRISNAIKSLWSHCKIEIFGSYATGLYLPTSDIDAVILDSGCDRIVSGLRAISIELRKRKLARKITIISKARVPIIKFVESTSGISFDISFDLRNGPEAAKFIQRAIGTLPPLRPLCMVLKIFLQQRELNEVYCGGIGSYGLLIMLITHLQMHPSRHHGGNLETNLGVLLLDFFDLFGRSLNIREVGVSCADGGRFFSKVSKGFVDYKRPFLLAVEDPQAPENDIGKNSFQIPKIRAAFVLAHRLLATTTANTGNTGILGRIIRGDSILTNRKRATAGDAKACTYFFDPIEELPDADTMQPKKFKYKKRHRPDDSKQHKKKKREEHEERRKRKRDEASSSSRNSRWKKVEERESPGPRLSRRTTYTDHCDHDGVDTGLKRVIVASPSHKKFKYS
ncbi:non-canonical poly(A) RNA polymerase PAPD5 [Selaginella moellendorffii]|uniref:non-canonical poly(A) RNA polymerase PAPD5 n=1 Tax=Selaginella moellendorffii TaxID=88036 RepID=UPI000D1C258B|nr:non-canonical poly(A) RNA polymerase PAPD5 [Selaginella moellendorffii]|eukprot:XP_024524838.1 non-canonical poly(A) RNA polymerase PAPD5 [Selaginella moellendorffii]